MKHETLSTFGALLRVFRKRCRLTQRQLATILGVHYNTISGWERGDTLPENKRMVLELGKCLRLDKGETRQLLEGSLTALTPYWNVPFRRNPFFTGHELLLEALHECLRPDQAVIFAQSYSIYGLGGMGKTQLAVEYAYRYSLEYTAVFWISGESVEQILTSFLAIAELLDLPGRQEANQQIIVAAVQRWLCNHGKWLLIWDNLEEVELLRRYLPPARQGSILVTTRCQALGEVAQNIELPVMTPEEGILLLLRRAKILATEATKEHAAQFAVSQPREYTHALELVTTLGGLPLALDQAGAYIEVTRCSICDYVSLLRSSELRLLEEYDESSDHPFSVGKTFALAFEQLERDNPSAVEIVTACAFLAPEAIPETFFLNGAAQLGATFEWLAADPFAFQAAFKALLKYSLIQRDAAVHTLSLHRLVQVVLKGRLSPMTAYSWAGRVTQAMTQLFPSDEDMQVDYWPVCEQLLSHALVCLNLCERGCEEETHYFPLMCHVATYLFKRARYSEAEPLFLRAVQMGETIPGLQQLLLTEGLRGLGMLYYEQGKYEQAEPLLERALRITEHTMGPDHPQIVTPLNYLGRLYIEQGKYERAKPLLERALRIAEQALDPDHPYRAMAMNNLGELYHQEGAYEQAEPLYQWALRIREQTLSADHPQIASPLTNLGILYGEQGKYTQAEPLLERALHIWEQALGSDHPYLATALSNLGEIYRQQGKDEQAEPLLERALHIWEQTLGPDNLQIAMVLDNLGNLYGTQARYEQSELVLERAVRILEQSLGPNHVHLVYPLTSLSDSYSKQGKYEQARSLYQRSLAIREQSLGPDHPKTLQTRSALHKLEEQMQDEEQEVFGNDQVSERKRLLLCACGCGNLVDTSKSRGEQKKFFSNACKQRSYRNTSLSKRNTTAV